jgi:hypothetical protein
LRGRHGAGAGVCQQVDGDLAGPEFERIKARALQELVPLGGGRKRQGLNRFDAEGLDDGARHTEDNRT